MPDESLRVDGSARAQPRRHDATYFVTWRVQHATAPLSLEERELVVGTLRHFDAARYALLAFVVMDDHVHVLLRPFRSFALERIVHSWKSYTAHVAQKRGRRGSLWGRGYAHAVIRNESDYEEKLAYIRTGPQRRWASVTRYPWLWYNPTGA